MKEREASVNQGLSYFQVQFWYLVNVLYDVHFKKCTFINNLILWSFLLLNNAFVILWFTAVCIFFPDTCLSKYKRSSSSNHFFFQSALSALIIFPVMADRCTLLFLKTVNCIFSCERCFPPYLYSFQTGLILICWSPIKNCSPLGHHSPGCLQH